jgi:hypothetical protein
VKAVTITLSAEKVRRKFLLQPELRNMPFTQSIC